MARDLPRVTWRGKTEPRKGTGPPAPTPQFCLLCSVWGPGLGWACFPPVESVRRSTPTPAGPLPRLSPQRHHFAQAIAILNTHGCNIFDHFSRKVMGLGVGGREWELGAGLRWERQTRGVEVPEV